MNVTIELAEPLADGFKALLTDSARHILEHPDVNDSLTNRGDIETIRMVDCTICAQNWIAESNVGWLGLSIPGYGNDHVIRFLQLEEGTDPETVARAWLRGFKP